MSIPDKLDNNTKNEVILDQEIYLFLFRAIQEIQNNPTELKDFLYQCCEEKNNIILYELQHILRACFPQHYPLLKKILLVSN